jgi:hypothetical protein
VILTGTALDVLTEVDSRIALAFRRFAICTDWAAPPVNSFENTKGKRDVTRTKRLKEQQGITTQDN